MRPFIKRGILRAATLMLVLPIPLSLWSQSGSQSAPSFGVNWNPAHIPNTSAEEVTQSLLEVASVGSYLSFFWEWQGGTPVYDVATIVVPAAQELGLQTLIQIQPTSFAGLSPPPDVAATSFSDPLLRSRYLADVSKVAALNPTYINLAPEINFLYLEDPAEFDQFQTLYAEAYSDVKQISPNTKVGVSYHLDAMFLFSQFDLIGLMGPQDYIGFTTYPAHFVYEGYYPSISQFPASYYTRVRQLTEKPIVFTEVGWPSEGRGSPQDEADFIGRLPELMAGAQPELLMWSKEHDNPHFSVANLTSQELTVLGIFNVDPQQLVDEVNTTGLLFWDGSPKPAWFSALHLPFK